MSTHRPRAPRLTRDEREKALLNHAITLFAEEGFAVNTRELARRAGVTQSLLYRYFPSKQALLDRVFQQVFLSKWKPNWETWIRDRDAPLDERLKRYYRDYAQTILVADWVRILVASGLKEPTITHKLFSLLRERIFKTIAIEIRHCHQLTAPRTNSEREMEIEIIWATSASIFYLGMRRWIYQTPVPMDLGPLIDVLVDGMIDNFCRYKRDLRK